MRVWSHVVSWCFLCASAIGEQVVDVVYEDGQVQMTAVDDGTVLLDARGISLHDGGPLDVLEPEIEVVAQDDGFDVIYTFTNDTKAAMPLGRLKLGVFPIGQEITWREFRWGGRELPADTATWAGNAIRYPLGLYSPIHVMHGDEWVIGVSLQYPIVEYKHDVTISMVSPGGQKAIGPGGQGWAVIYKMNNHGNEGEHIAMVHPASLAPGKTHRYTVSVRVTRKHDDWMRTLVPYRDYFNTRYGGVRYERDARAVLGFMTADEEFIEPENPEGWTAPNELRPDVFGWLPRIDWIIQRESWDRVMLWMPGGMYQYERESPFDFVLTWLTNANLLSAIDPEYGLHQIEKQDRRLGLWWSQSINYSESVGNLVGFDIRNRDHVEAALDELDLAIASGATMIGLDTFDHMKAPMWDMYLWIQILQARYPHVTFVIEPLTMDFMHTLVPSHFTGHDDRHGLPDNIEDIWMFHSPHYIADFLNPGHEIWGHYRYWAYQFYDVEVTPELIFEDMQKIADVGMAPTIFTGMDLDLPHPFDAKETWLETVPEDLLVFAPPYQAPRSVSEEIICIVDVDMDGTLSVLDFIAFQQLYASGDMKADINGDGILNIYDFIEFQSIFVAGCT